MAANILDGGSVKVEVCSTHYGHTEAELQHFNITKAKKTRLLTTATGGDQRKNS